MNNGLRHIGTLARGMPVVILGYHKQANTVAIVELSLLSAEEQSYLTDFIIKNYSDKTLSIALERTPLGQNSAWAHYYTKSKTLPIYEITVSEMNQCQEWTGSTSRFDPKLGEHWMFDRIRAAIADPSLTPPPGYEPTQVENPRRGVSNEQILSALTAITERLDRLETKTTSTASA